MKAAVFRDGKGLVIEEVPVPKAEPDGVVVKVRACGICGSDLHRYRLGGTEGWIMGHELSGDIVETGANITGVKEGDRVAAVSGRGCGRCAWCEEGEWIRCPEMMILGYGIPGAFAEYVSIPNFKPGLYAAKLPDNMTYEEGATMEPLSVAWHAVAQSRPRPEHTAVVIGLGIIGICVVPILKSMGVRQVIACGRRERRLNLAGENGADRVVDAAREDILPVVKEATGGRGADIVYDCAGTPLTFRQSLEMVHRGGTIDLVGIYQEPVTWSPSSIVSNDITLIGCGLRFDIPGAVDLVKSGRVRTTPLITHRFPLHRIEDAFKTLDEAPDAIKVMVLPESSTTG